MSSIRASVPSKPPRWTSSSQCANATPRPSHPLFVPISTHRRKGSSSSVCRRIRRAARHPQPPSQPNFRTRTRCPRCSPPATLRLPTSLPHRATPPLSVRVSHGDGPPPFSLCLPPASSSAPLTRNPFPISCLRFSPTTLEYLPDKSDI